MKLRVLTIEDQVSNTRILAMRIKGTTPVLSDVRTSNLIDGQTQQTVGITLDQDAIGVFKTNSILVPLHRRIWVSIAAGSELGLHSVIRLKIADAFQEGWWLSTFTSLTVRSNN